jgi:hypothetical protein
MEERVPQRRRGPSLLQRVACTRPFTEPVDRRARLAAEDELDLTELVRLETARRRQPVAEGQELERSNGL